MNDSYINLLSLAERRRSCRRFDMGKPVSEEEIERILAVAARAPFASGRSSWKVAVVRERATIAALAAQVRKSAEALAARMEGDAVPFWRRYAESFTFFEAAPVLLVPYCRETTTMKSILREQATDDILA